MALTETPRYRTLLNALADHGRAKLEHKEEGACLIDDDEERSQIERTRVDDVDGAELPSDGPPEPQGVGKVEPLDEQQHHSKTLEPPFHNHQKIHIEVDTGKVPNSADPPSTRSSSSTSSDECPPLSGPREVQELLRNGLLPKAELEMHLEALYRATEDLSALTVQDLYILNSQSDHMVRGLIKPGETVYDDPRIAQRASQVSINSLLEKAGLGPLFWETAQEEKRERRQLKRTLRLQDEAWKDHLLFMFDDSEVEFEEDTNSEQSGTSGSSGSSKKGDTLLAEVDSESGDLHSEVTGELHTTRTDQDAMEQATENRQLPAGVGQPDTVTLDEEVSDTVVQVDPENGSPVAPERWSADAFPTSSSNYENSTNVAAVSDHQSDSSDMTPLEVLMNLSVEGNNTTEESSPEPQAAGQSQDQDASNPAVALFPPGDDRATPPSAEVDDILPLDPDTMSVKVSADQIHHVESELSN